MSLLRRDGPITDKEIDRSLRRKKHIAAGALDLIGDALHPDEPVLNYVRDPAWGYQPERHWFLTPSRSLLVYGGGGSVYGYDHAYLVGLRTHGPLIKVAYNVRGAAEVMTFKVLDAKPIDLAVFLLQLRTAFERTTGRDFMASVMNAAACPPFE